jgi:hypothetical protein
VGAVAVMTCPSGAVQVFARVSAAGCLFSIISWDSANGPAGIGHLVVTR